MHERALRKVLLVHAIEESDRTGEVLPLADRADATRAVLRGEGLSAGSVDGATLSPATQRLLMRRSQRLLDQLVTRSPAVSHVLTLAGGATWLGRALLVIAFLSGASLSALDGSRQINVLAFPLVGLIAWNLIVYIVLLVAWLRRSPAAAASSPWGAALYERWIRGRVDSLLERSAKFNAPLASALRRFAVDWSAVAHPLLVARAKRLLHVSAALIAVGLIAGLYVRGIALRYEAGWESTFLEPAGVHRILTMLYSPAAALSGITLPDTMAEVRALRWEAGAGGGNAAPWIHLIAWTAALYIVVPRLLAALAYTVALWRLSRWPSLPASLVRYGRAILVGAGGGAREIVCVTPYAYEPEHDSIEGLQKLLGATLGGSVKVDVRDAVRYGDEEGFHQRLAHDGARTGSWNVLLMTLAATPEDENHGAVIADLRDWLAAQRGSAPLLVIVDESPYLARVAADAGLQARLEERRRLWRDFVAGYGLRACLADLANMDAGSTAEADARDAALTALEAPR